MKLDNSSINEILSIQEKESILDNKLLLLAYALDKGSITGVKHLLSIFDISFDELGEYFAIFLKAELTHKKDELLFNKLSKEPLISKKENALDEVENISEVYIEQAKEIIDHLGILVGIKFKHTKKRLAILQSKLMLPEVNVEKCKLLNLYYFEIWGNSVDMKQHLTIETLYNTKFDLRLEVSQKTFYELNKYRESIVNICKYYAAAFSSILKGKDFELTLKALENQDILSLVGSRPQRAIALWLGQGVSEKDITDTIYHSIFDWSKKAELIPKISLTKILDENFLKRLESVERKRQLSQGFINTASKKNIGFENWEYKGQSN